MPEPRIIKIHYGKAQAEFAPFIRDTGEPSVRVNITDGERSFTGYVHMETNDDDSVTMYLRDSQGRYVVPPEPMNDFISFVERINMSADEILDEYHKPKERGAELPVRELESDGLER